MNDVKHPEVFVGVVSNGWVVYKWDVNNDYGRGGYKSIAAVFNHIEGLTDWITENMSENEPVKCPMCERLK